MTRSTRPLSAALFGILALGLAACGATTPSDTASASASASETGDEHHDEHGDEEGHEGHDHEGEAGAATEASSRTPRLALTYDGGILVVDANTLETVADLTAEGFNRLNAVGDGRHVAVSTTGGWAILDAGTWSEPHGDHDHYWTSEPALHEVILEAEKPAHVVVHDGLTTFFDDGTGEVTVVHADDWTEAVEHGHLHPIREYQTAQPHHGVAVATEAGDLFVTRGDETTRTGAMLLDAGDAESVANDECPGVHGETANADANGTEFILVGCENGVLVLRDGTFTKIAAPDAYGRIGNAFSAEGSNAVLGDYGTDPEGGIGLTQISVVDLETNSVLVADPFEGSGAQYTWRDLARGAEGELLVLGTDGSLRVLEAHGDHVDVIHTIPVIDAWEVPEEWQAPHPALTVLDGMAYVTEPATGEIHVVDYAGGEVWKSADLGQEVIEIAGATG